MARREIHGAVRPLTVEPSTPQTMRRLPIAVAIAFVVIGASGGYLLGSPTDTANAAAPTDTAAPEATPTAPPTLAHYNWLKQRPAEAGQTAWAVSTVVGIEEYLYLLVSDDAEARSGRVLWRSSDGEVWDLIQLNFGSEVIVTDLDVYEGALMLSGWNGNAATVWRSQSLLNGADPVWTSVALPAGSPWIGDLVRESSVVNAEVNGSSEVVVVADMQLDITRSLLGLSGDSSVTSLLEYQELPDIAVADSRVWMKIVSPNGAKTIHTEDIPPTIKMTRVAGHYGTDVAGLQAGALWASSDGAHFEAVDLADLPVLPSPQAFEDIFVSTVADTSGMHQLWRTANGASWTPSTWVPPTGCGDWEGLAIGHPGLLVTSDDFGTICRTGNGTDWDVRLSASTKVSSASAVWIEGGTDGYLAVARNSLEQAVLTSTDGFHWNRVESSPDILGIRTFLIGERLVTIARPVGSARPRPLVVWVGEATDQ